jgi:predicted small lipoprotein YifL
MKLLISGLVAVAVSGALAGCGSTPPAEESSAGKSADDWTITASRVHIYSSLLDLSGDVQAIAVVEVLPDTSKAVPADQEGKTPIPATTVSVHPVTTIRGKLPSEATVRLITSPNEDSEVPSALKEGRHYVLFLTPFEWKRGVQTGEWTVPGGAGIYEVSGDSGSLTLVSRGPDEVPAKLESITALEQALAS